MATRKTTTEEQADAAAPVAGGVTGLAAGAVIGAAVGGPVGAAVGAAIGGASGAVIGEATNWADAEPQFRSHWESGPYKAITKWEDVSPAYRYGFETASGDEFRGKSYDEVSTHVRKGWKGKTRFEDVEPMIRTGWESRGFASSGGTKTASRAKGTATELRGDRDREAVIPVVEEELAVGKRKVEKGGVRVETTVTETPVEEQVHLHEEHVKVQRRPVNREATSADVAFKEGTIEMRESAEEAVVSKRARVVEEILISREGSDRTETVRDTVRKTDVDVKKTGGKAKVGAVEWETFASGFEKDFSKRYGKTGATFQEYTPAYRFGYSLANDDRYSGEWTTVEPEARRYWEEKNAGTWDEYKDAVRHSWDTVRGKR